MVVHHILQQEIGRVDLLKEKTRVQQRNEIVAENSVSFIVGGRVETIESR